MLANLELWELLLSALGAIATLLGGYWALVRIIVAQFKKNLDERFRAQEEMRALGQAEWNRRFEAIEAGHRAMDQRFNLHLQELPLKYQRREDAIRQEVAIIARLDALAGLVERQFQNTDSKIEALRRSQ